MNSRGTLGFKNFGRLYLSNTVWNARSTQIAAARALIFFLSLSLTGSVSFAAEAKAGSGTEFTVRADDSSSSELTANSGQSEEIVISLKSLVELAQPSISEWTHFTSERGQITLLQLVSVEQRERLDQTTLDAFKAILITDAPETSSTRTMSSASLAHLLRTPMREIQKRTGKLITFHIPHQVTVKWIAQQFTATEIEAELTSQFKKICGECEFEISRLMVPRISFGLDPHATWKLKTTSELPRASFSIPLEISRSNPASQPAQLFWVSGILTVRRKAQVATRAITIGEKISAQDLRLELRDVTFANDRPASLIDMKEAVAARQISAGEIVWKNHLRREAAIKTGETVKVSAGSDGWQITVDGVSQTTGYVGDSVQVKISRTQKIVSGLLKEKGLVEIQ